MLIDNFEKKKFYLNLIIIYLKIIIKMYLIIK